MAHTFALLLWALACVKVVDSVAVVRREPSTAGNPGATNSRSIEGREVPATINGCGPEKYSATACDYAARDLGLTTPEVGLFETTGCYAYYEGEFKGKAYYGKTPSPEGTGAAADPDVPDINADITDPSQLTGIQEGDLKYRVPGYGCCSVSMESCEAAATALGLSIGGGGYDFEGEWPTHGCYGTINVNSNHSNISYREGMIQGMAFYGQIMGNDVEDATQLNAVNEGDGQFRFASLPDECTVSLAGIDSDGNSSAHGDDAFNDEHAHAHDNDADGDGILTTTAPTTPTPSAADRYRATGLYRKRMTNAEYIRMRFPKQVAAPHDG